MFSEGDHHGNSIYSVGLLGVPMYGLEQYSPAHGNWSLIQRALIKVDAMKTLIKYIENFLIVAWIGFILAVYVYLG